MPRFIYDIIPPDIRRKTEAAIRKVSLWLKVFRIFLKTSKYGGLILIVSIFAFTSILVFAFQPEIKKVEIFPTQYTDDSPIGEAGWQGGEQALSRELSETSELAEFSSEN